MVEAGGAAVAAAAPKMLEAPGAAAPNPGAGGADHWVPKLDPKVAAGADGAAAGAPNTVGPAPNTAEGAAAAPNTEEEAAGAGAPPPMDASRVANA